MIIKTLVDSKNKKWWIVDNVTRLTFRKLNQSDISSFKQNLTMSSFDVSKPPEKECLLVCFLSRGDEQLYALNDITYLLNDEGKTIERIW